MLFANQRSSRVEQGLLPVAVDVGGRGGRTRQKTRMLPRISWISLNSLRRRCASLASRPSSVLARFCSCSHLPRQHPPLPAQCCDHTSRLDHAVHLPDEHLDAQLGHVGRALRHQPLGALHQPGSERPQVRDLAPSCPTITAYTSCLDAPDYCRMPCTHNHAPRSCMRLSAWASLSFSALSLSSSQAGTVSTTTMEQQAPSASSPTSMASTPPAAPPSSSSHGSGSAAADSPYDAAASERHGSRHGGWLSQRCLTHPSARSSLAVAPRPPPPRPS